MNVATESRSYCWTKWDNCGFPERVNHAVAANANFMYALGGFSGRGKPTTRLTREHESWNDLGDVPMDVIQFDIDTSTWERLYPPKEIEIKPPLCPESTAPSSHDSHDYSGLLPGRYAHSCVWYNGYLYMYGGRNDYRFFEEIECFDPRTRTWSVLKTTAAEDCDQPPGRYAHACTLNGPIMYIQGGTMLDPTGRALTYTDELISCNLETCVWQWEPVADGYEELPLARDFHSGVYINSKIIVFGGKCPFPNEDEDNFYEYSFGTHEWSQIETIGYHPPGRRSLQGVPYGEKSIIYFGGFSTERKIFYSDLFILNTDTRHVLKLKPYGLGPCPRRRVGMCLIGSDVILCGGVGRNQSKTAHHHTLVTFNDTYSLHLVPSLQHLCKETVINTGLPVDILPTGIQTSIYEMSNEELNDCQPLKGDLYSK